MLWGLLGISIPILIQLWRGKRGQVIQWAAMRWLMDEESSVAKGFRLENIWVLLLRILMLILLISLLSQVFISKLSEVSEERIIHLVQPSNQLTEEYKFELQQAIENGEEVFWADEKLSAIEGLEALNPRGKTSDLQASLSDIPSTVTALNLYLRNSQNEFKADFYLSPVKPTLFVGNAEMSNSPTQSLVIDGVNVLAVNEQGLLDSSSVKKEGTASINLAEADFSYFLAGLTDSERVFIQASLEAIGHVYELEFVEKKGLEEAKLVFDRQVPSDHNTDKLYFISDNFTFSEAGNLVSFSEKLDFEQSELVQTGKLPEVILESFLAFSGVEKRDMPLSKSQLESRFLVENSQGQNKKANLNLLFLGLFALCFAAERYFANRQGI
jgi:hypothetical protein